MAPAPRSRPTAEELAQWMAEEVSRVGELYQADAWDHINGANTDFALESDRGGLSISPEVLKAFRRITANTVVWESQGKFWRLRVAQDDSARKQS